MKQYIIISIIFFLLQSCNGQDDKMKESKTSNNNVEIVDPVVELPYEIKNVNQSITLLKSRDGRDMQGYVVLRLMINDKSEIVETSILKLSLHKKDNSEIIEYNTSQGTLPSNLNEYASFFDKYCKEKLNIVKKGTPQSKNLVQIRLKIE